MSITGVVGVSQDAEKEPFWDVLGQGVINNCLMHLLTGKADLAVSTPPETKSNHALLFAPGVATAIGNHVLKMVKAPVPPETVFTAKLSHQVDLVLQFEGLRLQCFLTLPCSRSHRWTLD